MLADGNMFPPHVILNHKNVPEEQMYRIPVVKCRMPDDCWWCGTEDQGMPVIDAFQGHVTPEIKVTITGRSTNTDFMVIPGWMNSAGAKSRGGETIQNHSEQMHGEWLLTRGHVVTPPERIKKTIGTISLSVDHNSMAERLTRSDCEDI